MADLTSEEVLSLVGACYAAWERRDIPGLIANFSDNSVYTIHVPTDVLSFAGEHRGKAALKACLEEILSQFSFLAYAVDGIFVTGDVARAQVVYYYRHTESGAQLDGRFRHVWRVGDGAIARLDEYHDVARLRAFVEMVRDLRS
jgi:ketosteroid isomerase-like protein